MLSDKLGEKHPSKIQNQLQDMLSINVFNSILKTNIIIYQNVLCAK